MEGEAGAIDGFYSFVMCVEFVLGGLAVSCTEENGCMFVDSCVNERRSFEEVDAIGNVVEEVKLESA